MIENKIENYDLSSPTGGQGATDRPMLPHRGTGGQIIPLSEGAFTVDKTKLFVPFDQEKDVLNERPAGSLLVEIQPFLIITSKDILLVDTGLGFSNSKGQLQIYDNVKAAGYDPSQITKVLISHLHKDHAGGIVNLHSGAFKGANVLNFPNAKYYVQQRELDYACQKGFPSFIPDEIVPLLHSQQVVFLRDDEGVIDDYIFYQHTGAHSAHHQVFWIKENDQVIFFGGDDAPQLQQMKIKYKTKYDFDADKAMNLRNQWWEQGNKEGWQFIFYHDIKTPVWPIPL